MWKEKLLIYLKSLLKIIEYILPLVKYYKIK